MIQFFTVFFVVLACGCAEKTTEESDTPVTAEATRSSVAPTVVSVGEIPTLTLAAGESAEVAVPIVVANGYHIQSNPASNKFLIPLELELEYSDDIELGDPYYPPGHPYRLIGTTEDLITYDGTINVTIPVKVSASALPGNKLLKGSLRYQACDSRRCLFPSSVPVTFAVGVSH